MYNEIVNIRKEGKEYLIFTSRGLLLSLDEQEYLIFEKYGKRQLLDKEHHGLLSNLCDQGVLKFKDYAPKPAKKSYDLSLVSHQGSAPLYPAPVLAHLAITHTCNMRCAYCSVRKLHTAHTPDLSTKQWTKVITDLARWGVFQIGFTGGEPTLRKDLPLLVRHVHDQGCVCNLTTNGWLLEEPLVEALVTAGLKQCQISLDSHLAPTHEKLRGDGSYARVMNAIALLQQKGVAVGIDCVVSKNNLKDIPGFIDWLAKKGIPYLTLIKLKKGDLSEEKYAALSPGYEEYVGLVRLVCHRKGNEHPNITLDCGSVANLQGVTTKDNLMQVPCAGCPVGHHLICISPNGDLYPCAALLGSNFKLGNVLSDDLSRLWYHHPLLQGFRSIKENISGKCKSCERLDLCRGGCRGIVFTLTGENYLSDPTCKFKEVSNEGTCR